MLKHRGTDPEAIKVAERYGLVFDGTQEAFGAHRAEYRFTTSDPYSLPERGISFSVDRLDQVKTRLDEKLVEFGQVMSEEDRWERLLHSIRKAARILGREITEPDHFNWFVARDMNDNLWAQVYAQNKTGRRFRYELEKRGW